MLNKLLHSSLGFAWTVRVAAFVVLGCLAVANMLIRPRVKPSPISLSIFDQLKVLFTDIPYLFLIVGYVSNIPMHRVSLIRAVLRSAFVTLIGMFYPCTYCPLKIYGDHK